MYYTSCTNAVCGKKLHNSDHNEEHLTQCQVYQSSKTKKSGEVSPPRGKGWEALYNEKNIEENGRDTPSNLRRSKRSVFGGTNHLCVMESGTRGKRDAMDNGGMVCHSWHSRCSCARGIGGHRQIHKGRILPSQSVHERIWECSRTALGHYDDQEWSVFIVGVNDIGRGTNLSTRDDGVGDSTHASQLACCEKGTSQVVLFKKPHTFNVWFFYIP